MGPLAVGSGTAPDADLALWNLFPYDGMPCLALMQGEELGLASTNMPCVVDSHGRLYPN